MSFLFLLFSLTYHRATLPAFTSSFVPVMLKTCFYLRHESCDLLICLVWKLRPHSSLLWFLENIKYSQSPEWEVQARALRTKKWGDAIYMRQDAEGDQNMPLRNSLLWRKGYFELKWIGSSRKNSLALPFAPNSRTYASLSERTWISFAKVSLPPVPREGPGSYLCNESDNMILVYCIFCTFL